MARQLKTCRMKRTRSTALRLPESCLLEAARLAGLREECQGSDAALAGLTIRANRRTRGEVDYTYICEDGTRFRSRRSLLASIAGTDVPADGASPGAAAQCPSPVPASDVASSGATRSLSATREAAPRLPLLAPAPCAHCASHTRQVGDSHSPVRTLVFECFFFKAFVVLLD